MNHLVVRRRLMAFLGASAASAVAGQALVPRTRLSDSIGRLSLENDVPNGFDGWNLAPQKGSALVSADQDDLINKLYSQILSRTYVDSQGYRIMLMIAYGDDQRDGLQVHYPEACYPAQGFKVDSKQPARLDLKGGVVPAFRLETSFGTARVEPVTYWVTVGEHIVDGGGYAKKLADMSYTLRGVIPDGLLFRISSLDRDSKSAFERHRVFAASLLSAVRPEIRKRLAGI